MISRPTTEQILLDCARELSETVMPKLTDAAAQMAVAMMDAVLRSMSARSAHEIAWMAEETDDIIAYVGDVAAALPSAGLQVPRPATSDGLHLDAVVALYCEAGRTFSTALEAVVAAQNAELVTRGEELLGRRIANEHAGMAGWSPTGR